MQLLVARPKSRGTVGLKSTNPFDLAKASLEGCHHACFKQLQHKLL